MEASAEAPVLVTGATGYIGGRLVRALLEAGVRVRCLARSPGKLANRSWSSHPRVEVVAGDLSDPAATRSALRGVRAAYYLVHSMMAAGSEYSARDRELARGFAEACEAEGVGRIVYLGGLGETGAHLSEHLSSRREVEQILASGKTPVTVLRAAMIIGSGSASFEILRYLVEHLPAMVTPRWVRTRCQPIAIRDVLFYLVRCLAVPETEGKVLDIGGPDVLTYRELIEAMTAARGLRRRLILPVPVLTPRLSSLWIHLVTPLSLRIARPLAEGLRNEVVCRDDEARRLMPHEPLGVREAIELALKNLREGQVETTWSDAGPMPGDPDWSGGHVFRDRWRVDVGASPEQVFRAVCRIGGGHGWYAADWLWRLRGWLDRLIGGPGLRRGRKDPENVGYGEALDFWRVTAVVPPERLLLRAEMKLPGEAELGFDVSPLRASADPGGDPGVGPGGVAGEPAPVTRLEQTARFIPRGLAGLAYWYAVLPLHHVVFRGMLDGIRRAAEAESGTPVGGALARVAEAPGDEGRTTPRPSP